MKSKHAFGVRFDPPEEPFDLVPAEGWPATRHQFDRTSTWAVRAAFATGRPLLVRGEPGTGKTQLARAAAQVLGRPLLYEVINSRTEVTDLLYTFDAVARLADAQVLGNVERDREAVRQALLPQKYVRPGRVWWALDWPGARKQAEESGAEVPAAGEESWRKGCVLLVDEIDKADAELPNALLECFANQSFQVPYLRTSVCGNAEQPSPLVVVTTNEERELPGAFLRRCLVLHLQLEADDDKLKRFLVARGEVHFSPVFGKTRGFRDILVAAAERLVKDRSDASGAVQRPGQAEYLDLCRAVFSLAADGVGAAAEIMREVGDFAMRKNPL